MKCILVKCGICLDWYSPIKGHCSNCGAFHITPKNGKGFYCRKDGIEVVRGLPVSVDGMLNRLVKYVSESVTE